MATDDLPCPDIYINEGYTLEAVLANPDGTPKTGLTLNAEVMNSAFTKISTGTVEAVESPPGTYTATIPGANLSALTYEQNVFVRLFTPDSKLLDARGKKVARYRPIS